MFLFIDATQENGMLLKLTDGQRILNTKIIPGDRKLAERLLLSIDSYLSEQEVRLSELKGIVIVNGPGSFTNVRIVCTMANTLSQLADIPVFGDHRANLDTDSKILEAVKKVVRKVLIIPFYDREPNITLGG